MMQIINNFRKRVYLPYRFYLTILLNFAGACKEKKYRLPLPSSKQVEANLTRASGSSLPSSKQVEANLTRASGSSLPSSKQVEANLASAPGSSLPSSKQVEANLTRASGSSSPVSNVMPMNNFVSQKHDQASTISHLSRVIKEEKEYREKFSQTLGTIKDLSKRDEMIESFVAQRKQRIEAFNLCLKKVIDPNEQQRLIAQFNDVKGMCEELNLLNAQYSKVLDPNEQKERNQKHGDIVEQYNGYEIEAKRQQIKRRVEDLMKFVIDKQDPNKPKNDTQCAICKSTESVGLLPCGDYVHAGCLVEEMIAVWRMGYEFVCTCPGSCGNYLGFHYFLLDDAYVKTFLNPDELKEIFFKPQS